MQVGGEQLTWRERGQYTALGQSLLQNIHSGIHLLQTCYTEYQPRASSTEKKKVRGGKKIQTRASLG